MLQRIRENSKYLTNLGLVLALLTTVIITFIFRWYLENQSTEGSDPQPLIFLTYYVITLIASFAGAALTIGETGKEDSIEPSLFLIFISSICISAIEIAEYIAPLDGFDKLLTSMTIGTTSALTYAQIKTMIGTLRIQGKFENFLTWAPTIGVLALGINLLFVAPKTDSGYFLALASIGIIAGFPVIISGLIAITPHLRWDKKSIRNSIFIIIFRHDDKSERSLFYQLCGLHLVLFSGLIYFGNLPSSLPPGNPGIGWIAAMLYLFKSIEQRQYINNINNVVVSITSKKAKRFFLRQDKPHSRHWAATVGMKTASFVVDHDPKDEATSRLTATLSHIRKEEISKFTRNLLGKRTLHLKSIGNQISGSIDPEDSNRPCVDVLTLFACIYLDVVPMVEKRLKGLVSLFPIIDPELAKRINTQNVIDSHSKMEWLYHFDYNWVDQQLILNGAGTSYGVSIDRFNSMDRNNILNYLQDRNRTGNFIWIGDNARQRLKMEAPYLSSIIEAWPIDIGGASTIVYFFKRG